VQYAKKTKHLVNYPYRFTKVKYYFFLANKDFNNEILNLLKEMEFNINTNNISENNIFIKATKQQNNADVYKNKKGVDEVFLEILAYYSNKNWNVTLRGYPDNFIQIGDFRLSTQYMLEEVIEKLNSKETFTNDKWQRINENWEVIE